MGLTVLACANFQFDFDQVPPALQVRTQRGFDSIELVQAVPFNFVRLTLPADAGVDKGESLISLSTDFQVAAGTQQPNDTTFHVYVDAQGAAVFIKIERIT